MKPNKPDRFKQNTDETRRQLDEVKRLTVKERAPYTESDLPPLPSDFASARDLIEATREILRVLLLKIVEVSDVIEARVTIQQQINVLTHLLAEVDKRRG